MIKLTINFQFSCYAYEIQSVFGNALLIMLFKNLIFFLLKMNFFNVFRLFGSDDVKNNF